MKRVLSWVVLVVVSFAFNYVQSILWRLFTALASWLYGASSVAFWVAVVIIGSGIFWGAFVIIGVAANFIAMLSQKIRKSKKGTRYIVLGVWYVLYNVVSIILLIKGIIIANGKLEYFLAYGTMIVYGIVLSISGKGIADNDGPPPSKIEELEAKLAKEKAKAEAQSK